MRKDELLGRALRLIELRRERVGLAGVGGVDVSGLRLYEFAKV